MPLTATHVTEHEPVGTDSRAGNNHAPDFAGADFLGADFLARMPFFDGTSTPQRTETLAGQSPVVTRLQAAASKESGLAARMRLLIRGEGSMAAIARRCGFSEGAVRSWRDGQSDISRERCVIMARTLDVSLIWLITGEGPMRSVSSDADAPRADTRPSSQNATSPATRAPDQGEQNATRSMVDSRVLAAALRLLQSYIGLLGGSLNPMQRADVLAELYDILRNADQPDHVDRLIAFHTTLSGQMRRGGALVA